MTRSMPAALHGPVRWDKAHRWACRGVVRDMLLARNRRKASQGGCFFSGLDCLRQFGLRNMAGAVEKEVLDMLAHGQDAD